jgi:hypothetical protein
LEIALLKMSQTAYEREAAAGSKLHDKDLQVLAAKCHDDSGGTFLCEVTFISNQDPNKGDERLYFEVVAVARTADGWELKSGLCKGPKLPTVAPNGAADRSQKAAACIRILVGDQEADWTAGRRWRALRSATRPVRVARDRPSVKSCSFAESLTRWCRRRGEGRSPVGPTIFCPNSAPRPGTMTRARPGY